MRSAALQAVLWGESPGRLARRAYLSGDCLQACLQALVSEQFGLELADALSELSNLDPQPVRLGDLDVLAQDHPVGGFEGGPTSIGPARLQGAPAALAEDAVEGPHLARCRDALSGFYGHEVGQLPAHQAAQLLVV